MQPTLYEMGRLDRMSESAGAVNAAPTLTTSFLPEQEQLMATSETKSARLPFQPRPGCDDLLSVLLLWRLAERVVARESGCWEWTGATTGRGYGSIKATTPHTGKVDYVHRLVCVLCVGEIPTGQQALHRCDNPACCRPEHLFIGTQKDNVADMDAKKRRRVVSPPGEDAGASKLTEEQVMEIRSRAAAGECTDGKMAREYRIHHATLRRIVTRKTWKHVS
jgi:hypothetical protein